MTLGSGHPGWLSAFLLCAISRIRQIAMICGNILFGPQKTGDHMTHYIIYFNQQWVGDHSQEWIQSRGPLATAVVAEMKEAGVLVFAAGVDEDLRKAFSADQTSGELHFGEGRYSNTPE